jgi:hypothetical protein
MRLSIGCQRSSALRESLLEAAAHRRAVVSRAEYARRCVPTSGRPCARRVRRRERTEMSSLSPPRISALLHRRSFRARVGHLRPALAPDGPEHCRRLQSSGTGRMVPRLRIAGRGNSRPSGSTPTGANPSVHLRRVKRVLGLHAPWVLTPWQLYRLLTGLRRAPEQGVC